MMVHGARVRKWGYLIPYLVCQGMFLTFMTIGWICMLAAALCVPAMIQRCMFSFLAYTFAVVIRCVVYIQDCQRAEQLAQSAHVLYYPQIRVQQPAPANAPPPYAFQVNPNLAMPSMPGAPGQLAESNESDGNEEKIPL